MTKERKPRATSSLDRSVAVIRELEAKAREHAWSPKRLRFELSQSRGACRPVWRRAIVKVFGAGILELPDMRQQTLWGCANGQP